MRLIEAIMDANQRYAKGEALKVEEHGESLPLLLLTCIDPRLNKLVPDTLGLPDEQFIWLRNAGNIITGPLSSTMRTLALGLLVKGGKEVAVIGHTDCQVGKASMLTLTDAMKKLGVDRARLPENLIEYFGAFSSERQNVMKAVEFIRASPLIGPKVPVHGLLLDIASGRLEWLVNGYEALETVASKFTSTIRKPETLGSALEDMPDFKIGNLEFPTSKIGELASKTGDLLHRAETAGQQAAKAYEQARDGLYGETIGQATGTRGSEQIGAHPSEKPHAAEIHRPTIGERIGDKVGEKLGEFIDEKLGVAGGGGDSPIERLKRKIDLNRRYNLIGSDQKRYGPVGGRIVVQWLEDTRIDANTPVQVEGSEIWQTLGSLPDHGRGPKLPPPITPGAKSPKNRRW